MAANTIMFKVICVLFLMTLYFLSVFGRTCVEGLTVDEHTIYLKPGEKFNGHIGCLQIYCYHASEKSLLHLWKSLYVEFTKVPEEYSLFAGATKNDVQLQYDEHMASWFPILPWRQATVVFPSFSPYCIGISSSTRYTIQLTVRNINFWKVLQTLVGILLYITAPTLSKNIIFHYISGTSFGVFASFLIVIFLLSRFIPKKAGAYSLVVFGWSGVLYCFQILWSNFYHVLQNYSSYLLGYIITTTVLSFVCCYLYGPVTNYRILNVVQWSMQLVAVILIFFSSEYHEAATAIIIVLVIGHAIPYRWIVKGKTVWKKYFPPKVKLLTEAEYLQQANEETRKSLESLRTYCRSPECNAWQTVCKLKDPIRFAKFVAGDSHLIDQEILDYDSDSIAPYITAEMTDDSDDDFDQRISIYHERNGLYND